jgi:hypothetical protein
MSTTTTPELPGLDPGLTRLETDTRCGALHSLVLDRVLSAGGSARWIDANGHATTRPLYRLAPDRRVLDRVGVARAFTAVQHYSLVADVTAALPDDTSLLVLPTVDWFYATDDCRRGEGHEMLDDALALVERAAADRDLPVLLTTATDGPLAARVAEATDHVVACTDTAMGPRFRSDDFETLVYPDAGGLQTTLAFWQRVLAARHPDRVGERADTVGGSPRPEETGGPAGAEPGGAAPPSAGDRRREVTVDGAH